MINRVYCVYKNPTPSPAPAPIFTLNDTIACPLTNSNPTRAQLPMSDSPGAASLTQSQHNRYSTEEGVPGESEWITKKSPTKYGSLINEVACAVKEQSHLMLFVESDGSDPFSAPHNLESRPRSGGRDSVGVADKFTDVSPLKPVGELPTDAPKLETPKGIEYIVTTKDGGDSVQPEDLVVYTTQGSGASVFLPAFTIQPPLSIPEVAGQGDPTGHPSEEGVVGAYRESNSENGHVVEEEESKIEHIKGVEDEAKPTPSPHTSFTPGTEEDSPVPEDQPHPTKRAKKRSETDSISLTSVRDFCRI